MSNSKHTDLICIIITVIMAAVLVLFINAEALGVTVIRSDDTVYAQGGFTESDLDASWDAESAVYIDLESLEISGGGAYESDGDILISTAGTYVLTGSAAENTRVSVSAKGAKVTLVLNGVTIENTDRAPLIISEASKVKIILEEGSENRLSINESLCETDIDLGISAALWSKADLCINGSGSLSIDSYDINAVRTSDDMVITGGNYVINAGENGIVGHDSLRINDGVFDITAAKDALKSNSDDENENHGLVIISGGEFTLNSGNDAIQAEKNLAITDGTFNITTGEGASESTAGGGFGGMGGGMQMPGGTDAGSSEMPQMPDGTDASSSEMPQMPDGTDAGSSEMPQMHGIRGAGGGMQMPGGTDSSSSETQMPGGTDAGSGFEGMDGGMQTPDGMNAEGGEMPEDQAGTSEDAESFKGLKAGTEIVIDGGSFDLNTEDDGIHSNGSVTINGGSFIIASSDDAVHADESLTINDGSVYIEFCYEGIEGKSIIVNGGDIDVTSSDDGFNASNGSGAMFSESSEGIEEVLLEINGGTITVDADGDGLDSNYDLIINGGTIYVNGPTDGANGALDSGSESGGQLIVNGGTILALGSSEMAESFGSGSEQASLNVTFSSEYSSGDELVITDDDGNIILEYTILKSGSSVIFSSPELAEGSTYTVTAGDESQTAEAGYEENTGFGGMGGGFGGQGGDPAAGGTGGQSGSLEGGSFGGRAGGPGAGGFGQTDRENSDETNKQGSSAEAAPGGQTG